MVHAAKRTPQSCSRPDVPYREATKNPPHRSDVRRTERLAGPSKSSKSNSPYPQPDPCMPTPYHANCSQDLFFLFAFGMFFWIGLFRFCQGNCWVSGEPMVAQSIVFFGRISILHHPKKSSFSSPFWRPKVDPGPKKVDKKQWFTWFFQILKHENIKSVRYTQHFVRVGCFSVFICFCNFFMFCFASLKSTLREHFWLLLTAPRTLENSTCPSKVMLSSRWNTYFQRNMFFFYEK